MEQLEGILSHRISSDDMAMPVISSAKKEDEMVPKMGYGKYGDRVKTDDISDEAEFEADYPYEAAEET